MPRRRPTFLLYLFLFCSNVNALSTTGTNSNSMSLFKNVRIELFFKTNQELKERVSWLQKQHGITAFNLVNKHDADPLHEWVDIIREQCKAKVDISVHYSLKFQKVKRKTPVEHYDKLQSFLQNHRATEVLLVSGSIKTDAWNSAVAIQKLTQNQDSVEHKHRVAVAYNPFLPDKKERDLELQSLETKLQTGRISKVYLQFGIDLELLQEALDYLSLSPSSQGIPIAASMFLPTAKLIAQQRFRPWKGVFLSDDFLSGPGKAREAIVDLLRLYKKYDVEVLFEAPGIRNDKDMDLVESLLRERDSDVPQPRVEEKTSNPEPGTESKTNRSKALKEDPPKPVTDGKTKRGKAIKENPPKRPKVQDTATTQDTDTSNSEPGSDEKTDGGKLLKENPAKPGIDGKTNRGKAIKENPAKRPKVHTETTQNTMPSIVSNAGRVLQKPAIVIFGSHDVRWHDNNALHEAARHSFVIPVFLWDRSVTQWGVRGAQQVVLKDAVRSLAVSLDKEFQLPLICRNVDDPVEALCALVKETNAGAVYWNREFTPESRALEKQREAVLHKLGVRPVSCVSSLLYDVEKLELSKGFHGGHWGTLMPFLNGCKKQLGQPPRPIPTEDTVARLSCAKPPPSLPAGISVDELDLATMPPNTKWDQPILQRFPMSYEVAQARLDHFFVKGLPHYENERSRADKDVATSQLSAHLRIGTLSPHELYWRAEDSTLSREEKKTFARRLIWRDLAYFHLYCFPLMRDRSIREHYEKTEWVSNVEERRRFEAWKKGMTGYPIVDAGMRELYATGWMTQSVRMVVASFLTEYLRINWTKGADWFHYTLVDADSAINPMMWQNAGRSGIDQWNFVLSPVNASQDPSGIYTRKWVPELDGLPKQYLHRPWQASQKELEKAGVVLGENYPHRVIDDLEAERAKTIESVLAMRRDSQRQNDGKGYDIITLPSGDESVVFTRKGYRLDRAGQLMKEFPVARSAAPKNRAKSTRKRR
jgi:deoxyribodipyrimidine photolyase